MQKKKLFSKFFFIAVSVITFALIFTDSSINRDGIAYLQQAKMINEGFSINEIFIHYPWPFYSLIIFAISYIFPLSYVLSAKLINFVLFNLSIYFFTKITNEINKNENPNLFIFSILIIICSIPIYDTYLTMILRDHGAWAFYLGGLYYFILYSKYNHTRFTLFFQVCFFIGFLFRPDLIILLLFGPLIYFLYSKKTITLRIFLSNYFVIILSVLMFIILIVFFDGNITSRINEIWNRPYIILKTFFTPLNISSDDYFISDYISKYPYLIKFTLLSSIAISKLISVIGFLNIILLIYFFKNYKTLIENKYLTIIISFSILSFLISYSNLYVNNIITARYFVISLWGVLILCSLSLLKISQSKQKINFIIYLLIFLYLVTSLIDKKTESFEQKISSIIIEKNINKFNYFSNNERINFYINGDVDHRLLMDKNTNFLAYDYLIIDNKGLMLMDKNEIEIIEHKIESDFLLLDTFINKKNKVRIYKKDVE